jgi:hypothetical protein
MRTVDVFNDVGAHAAISQDDEKIVPPRFRTIARARSRCTLLVSTSRFGALRKSRNGTRVKRTETIELRGRNVSFSNRKSRRR